MKKLSKVQEMMLENWLQDAEKENLQQFEVQHLDAKISSIIKSIEYEKPLRYFDRILM